MLSYNSNRSGQGYLEINLRRRRPQSVSPPSAPAYKMSQAHMNVFVLADDDYKEILNEVEKDGNARRTFVGDEHESTFYRNAAGEFMVNKNKRPTDQHVVSDSWAVIRTIGSTADLQAEDEQSAIAMRLIQLGCTTHRDVSLVVHEMTGAYKAHNIHLINCFLDVIKMVQCLTGVFIWTLSATVEEKSLTLMFKHTTFPIDDAVLYNLIKEAVTEEQSDVRVTACRIPSTGKLRIRATHM